MNKMQKSEKKACVWVRFCHYIVMTIKNFSDLVFSDHPNSSNGVIATLDLGNNLEISLVAVKSGASAFGSHYGSLENGTYEVAVFHNSNMLPLTPWEDVRGWQTEADITELMAELQGDASDIHGFIAFLYTEKDEAWAELELD